jgi:hypothetical protein
MEDIFNVAMAIRCLKGAIELDSFKLLTHLNQLHTNVYAGSFSSQIHSKKESLRYLSDIIWKTN